MKIINRVSAGHLFLLVISIIVCAPLETNAQVLKGKLSLTSSALSPSDFTLVAQTKNGIRSAAVGADGKFSLNGASSVDRLSLLHRSNFYSPVVLAVKRGKKIKNFKAAVRSNYCRKKGTRVVLATKKKLRGKLAIEVNPALGIAYVKKVSTANQRNYQKGTSAEAAASCLPVGLKGTDSSELKARAARFAAAENPLDPDGDGIVNDADLDDDDDGVSDAFDPDNDGDGIIDDADPDNNDRAEASQIYYFQQLHLDREHSFHPKLQSVTPEMIDAALRTYGGLAIEVKSGDTVELNCGGISESSVGLPWCSKGGTGRTREPYPDGLKFPEDLDADGDGKAEITAGGTGDLQLLPGSSSNEIRPGDTFIEEVTIDGVETQYAGVLNSVVYTVPGIVSITTDVGTYTFDYPASSSSIGTYSNPVLVPSSGDAIVTITVYPPLYNTEAGEIVPGRMTMGTQIPNGPCTYDVTTQHCMSGENGPGLLPGSLYSNPSAGWEVASDGVRTIEGTLDVSSDDSAAVTYTLNLTGSGGVTGWDAGEYVKVPIQAFDQNGTTSAHNVIFRRLP